MRLHQCLLHTERVLGHVPRDTQHVGEGLGWGLPRRGAARRKACAELVAAAGRERGGPQQGCPAAAGRAAIPDLEAVRRRACGYARQGQGREGGGAGAQRLHMRRGAATAGVTPWRGGTRSKREGLDIQGALLLRRPEGRTAAICMGEMAGGGELGGRVRPKGGA